MLIRDARRSDIPDVARVWEHSFPGGPTLADRIRTLETGGLHGGIETVIMADVDGNVVGALKTTPFTQYMGGAALPMLGLAAVGVSPQARRMGVAGAMCREALRRSHQRGDVVSALYPFRPSFYHRLGWGMAGRLHSHRFTPDNLPDTGDPDVRLIGTADLQQVYDCYERTATTSNGMILRDQERWNKHLTSPDTHVFAATGNNAIDGYLLVRYGKAATGERRPLWIREMIADDETARTRLLSWISRQRDLWRRVRYDAAPDEHFEHRLVDPRPPGYRAARWLWAETATIIHGPMFRLIDVGRAFSVRQRWGDCEPFDFTLESTDDDLADNDGVFHVAFDGNRASINRLHDRTNAAGPTGEASRIDHAPGEEAASPAVSGPANLSGIRLTVGAPTLARIYAGELSVSSAVSIGSAQVSGDPTRLDRFFQPTSSFRLLDEF